MQHQCVDQLTVDPRPLFPERALERQVLCARYQAPIEQVDPAPVLRDLELDVLAVEVRLGGELRLQLESSFRRAASTSLGAVVSCWAFTSWDCSFSARLWPSITVSANFFTRGSCALLRASSPPLDLTRAWPRC